ncbi:BgtTE-56045 [Blumeria graminis f. sp. tritici]|uniref:BgtTE-56045 n=1 Tax=Blumeria graminis f. sp. tritici TaxID=62690 RepID=A0A9X9MF94_BLUGR|nr:BgtTE-56045 [Blumeria graminis f. sp. tritici]
MASHSFMLWLRLRLAYTCTYSAYFPPIYFFYEHDTLLIACTVPIGLRPFYCAIFPT